VVTHIGIGFSRDANAENAAKEAALQSKADLQDGRIDFALILSTMHYAPQRTLPVLNQVLNQTRMIGCSTAGIILSTSIETRGIAVLAIHSDDIQFGIGSVKDIHTQDVRSSGVILGKNSVTDFGNPGRQFFIFFVDGFLKNNSLFLRGLQEVLGNVFPIVGAGSCDDFHFSNSFQIFRNKVLEHSATGLLLGGHVNVGIGAQHGWRPLGKPRVIDKADGNVIITIDGKKASSLYEEYFDKEAENLRSARLGQMAILYPLGIKIAGESEYLLRNAVEILEDGSIVCQGDVPEGHDVHIMIGNKDSCKQAAVGAALEAKKNLKGALPRLIIIIESMARLKLLGRIAFEEVKRIKEIFGLTVPVIGMYSDGEICPFQSIESIKRPLLQNESIVIVAIS